jgi:hypothetical protein
MSPAGQVILADRPHTRHAPVRRLRLTPYTSWTLQTRPVLLTARGLDNGVARFPQMVGDVKSDEDLVLDPKRNYPNSPQALVRQVKAAFGISKSSVLPCGSLINLNDSLVQVSFVGHLVAHCTNVE